ncbi:2,3-diaminopropionate biosynthesis protein SbnA [Planktothrix sp. FACHB-1355]|uniref:2,3-diaminopropionate biosynthesis protein SbnA n=1 Tax=Planktothrix sp. FACHB-1355 TaxID=2692854 RepID=UPI00168B44B1|nr:2,3-diaminopropionate biosynthesis protein SbnA [Planktothrix sp. FACHB-1355]MBD3557352.1 2,3-diaminopropionate biosynthesis protein SbnA [Planktothrix sp. FACHB-1355]
MINSQTIRERTAPSVSEGILETIGNTPLVNLKRINPEFNFNAYAKLESFNPGGSIKDRPALNVLREALNSKKIDLNTTIIESSSGNMGIGLAQACGYLGMKFICVVDKKTTSKNIEILKVLGAEVFVITEPDAETGEFLAARIKKVNQLLETIPNSFWTNQYANLANAHAHYSTFSEILDALDGRLDYLFCSTSSCGTIRGCSEYARKYAPNTRIIGVDAVGSVIFGHEPTKRIIPGHGSALVPGLLNRELIDDVVHVSDWDCVVGCRRLIKYESLLVGGSSGGVYRALTKYAERIEPGSNCAMVFPDRGERYLDTIYSDDWVLENFSSLPQI